MTVEEWELIAHVHAYRKDGNVPKQERYVQATYIRYVEIGNTRRFNPVYGNVSTGNSWKRLVALPVAVASVYLSIGM